MKLEQRKFVSDKLGSLGNFAIVALVFGQLVGAGPVRYTAFWLGVSFWAFCMISGYFVIKGEE